MVNVRRSTGEFEPSWIVLTIADKRRMAYFPKKEGWYGAHDPKFRELKTRLYVIEKAKSYLEVECQQPDNSVVQALSAW